MGGVDQRLDKARCLIFSIHEIDSGASVLGAGWSFANGIALLPMEAPDLIDLEHYPIHDPARPACQELIEQSARDFERDGFVLLPDFLGPVAIERIVDETRATTSRAFFCETRHNVFLDSGDPSLPAEHARNTLLETGVGSIANDDLGETTALQALYDWQPLNDFIAAVLGYDQLFCSADPLGALTVNVYRAGDGHGWHFDEAEFTVTLMVQQPSSGGDFECVTGLRGNDPIDSDALGDVLTGRSDQVNRLTFEPGTLSIFGGRKTLHRVTNVAGSDMRLVPVLTYDTQPGAVNSPEVRELFWGRSG